MTVDQQAAVTTRGPAVRTSVIVLVVGLVVAIPGVVVMVLATWHVIFGPTYAVPGAAHLHLGDGTYIVFENTAHSSSYGPVTVTRGHGVTIRASEVTVTDNEGRSIPVRPSQPNESISRSSNHYTSAVEFTTPRAGDFDVRIDSSMPTTVMIERPLGDLFGRHVPWLVDNAVGWLIAVVGAWMLILGAARRGRDVRRARRRAATLPRVAPAAWYPDPSGTARLRYWDGGGWTDHTAD